MSREALIDDIRTDCEVARKSLRRPGYEGYGREAWLRGFEWVKGEGGK